MKKTLIALAALAATSAFAQVSITGTLQMAVGSASYGGAADRADLARPTASFTLGGVEDLGGGTKASFTIQQGVYSYGTTSTPTTPSATQVGDRIAMVTLSGDSWGAVNMGRNKNSSSLLYNFGDISNLKLITGPDDTSRSADSPRGRKGQDDSVYFGNIRSNTVSYVSPKINGFTVVAGLTPLDYEGDGTPDPDDASQTQQLPYAVAVVYESGPLKVGFDFTDYRNRLSSFIGTSKHDHYTQVTSLAGSYNFGFAKLGGIYQKIADNSDGKSDNNSYLLSVNVPITGQLEIGALYGYRGANSSAAYNPEGVSHSAVGLNYNLSKRTSIFAGLNRKDSGRALDKNDAVETNFGLAHNF